MARPLIGCILLLPISASIAYQIRLAADLSGGVVLAFHYVHKSPITLYLEHSNAMGPIAERARTYEFLAAFWGVNTVNAR